MARTNYRTKNGTLSSKKGEKSKKSFYATEDLKKKMKEVAETDGVTENFLQEVAVWNYVSFSKKTRRKLESRYHAIMAYNLNPEKLKKKEDIVQLLDADLPLEEIKSDE